MQDDENRVFIVSGILIAGGAWYKSGSMVVFLFSFIVLGRLEIKKYFVINTYGIPYFSTHGKFLADGAEYAEWINHNQKEVVRLSVAG